MATAGFSSPAARLCGHRPISGGIPAKRLAYRIRSSGGEDAPPFPSESPVETAKRSPSLISAANVQKALRGIGITNADHYGRLGIDRDTPYDQIDLAYKRKCEELMNQDSDEENISKELELLKESYAILSSEEEKRLYDWSLARSEKPDRYIWPFQVDKTQMSTETPPPQEPEDEGPTMLVGYAFLAWLILSIVVSVTLIR